MSEPYDGDETQYTEECSGRLMRESNAERLAKLVVHVKGDDLHPLRIAIDHLQSHDYDVRVGAARAVLETLGS